MNYDAADAILRNWGRWTHYQSAPKLGFPPPATTRNYRRSNADEEVWQGDPDTAAMPPPNETMAAFAEAKIKMLPRRHVRVIVRHYSSESYVDALERDAAIRAFCDICQSGWD